MKELRLLVTNAQGELSLGSSRMQSRVNTSMRCRSTAVGVGTTETEGGALQGRDQGSRRGAALTSSDLMLPGIVIHRCNPSTGMHYRDFISKNNQKQKIKNTICSHTDKT